MVLDVSIILPDRVFWRSNVKELILPTLSGQMGVLKDHIPVLTGLDTGVLYVRELTNDDWVLFFITGGFSLIDNNKIIILVSEAEFSSEINSDEIEQEFLSCKMAFETTQDPKKRFELGSRFKRLRAKYQIVQEKKRLNNF